jgi:ferritin-like metal-binding protein YciE
MADPKTHLRDWLRDAHAMERQAISMLSAQADRLETYPELRAAVRRHLEETRTQAERLAECLKTLGEDTSTVKDLGGRLAAFAQGLGGMMAEDEAVKGGLAAYAFEQMEIGAYRVNIAAAEAAGEPGIARVLEDILREEMAMADWLYDHLPDLAVDFVGRDAVDAPAKR